VVLCGAVWCCGVVLWCGAVVWCCGVVLWCGRPVGGELVRGRAAARAACGAHVELRGRWGRGSTLIAVAARGWRLQAHLDTADAEGGAHSHATREGELHGDLQPSAEHAGALWEVRVRHAASWLCAGGRGEVALWPSTARRCATPSPSPTLPRGVWGTGCTPHGQQQCPLPEGNVRASIQCLVTLCRLHPHVSTPRLDIPQGRQVGIARVALTFPPPPLNGGHAHTHTALRQDTAAGR